MQSVRASFSYHISHIGDRKLFDSMSSCDVCRESVDFMKSSNNPILKCEKCEIRVHARCYNICEDSVHPSHAWRCHPCKNQLRPTRLPCKLCSNFGGAYQITADGSYVHSCCAVWFPELLTKKKNSSHENGKEFIFDFSKFSAVKFRRKCELCINDGAAVKCADVKCKRYFHPYCVTNRATLKTVNPTLYQSMSSSVIWLHHKSTCGRQSTNTIYCSNHHEKALARLGKMKSSFQLSGIELTNDSILSEEADINVSCEHIIDAVNVDVLDQMLQLTNSMFEDQEEEKEIINLPQDVENGDFSTPSADCHDKHDIEVQYIDDAAGEYFHNSPNNCNNEEADLEINVEKTVKRLQTKRKEVHTKIVKRKKAKWIDEKVSVVVIENNPPFNQYQVPPSIESHSKKDIHITSNPPASNRPVSSLMIRIGHLREKLKVKAKRDYAIAELRKLVSKKSLYTTNTINQSGILNDVFVLFKPSLDGSALQWHSLCFVAVLTSSHGFDFNVFLADYSMRNSGLFHDLLRLTSSPYLRNRMQSLCILSHIISNISAPLEEAIDENLLLNAVVISLEELFDQGNPNKFTKSIDPNECIRLGAAGMYLLANICFFHQKSDRLELVLPIVMRFLTNATFADNFKLLGDCCLILCAISKIPDEGGGEPAQNKCIATFLNYQKGVIVERLMALMKLKIERGRCSKDIDVIFINSLRTLSNLMLGTHEKTEIVLNLAKKQVLYPILFEGLHSTKPGVCSECCQVVLNITGDSVDQMRSILQAPDLISTVAKFLHSPLTPSASATSEEAYSDLWRFAIFATMNVLHMGEVEDIWLLCGKLAPGLMRDVSQQVLFNPLRDEDVTYEAIEAISTALQKLAMLRVVDDEDDDSEEKLRRVRQKWFVDLLVEAGVVEALRQLVEVDLASEAVALLAKETLDSIFFSEQGTNS